ncbi:carbamoyltransferase HypF [Actinocorallia sp. API 0066]|uniref:carbamoyltransferase HypF n=1 Tax=Actinocorallia sp. API 0066 TaxID=2896846 RepID=UPI001E5EFE00|nr:carbamoyltransferase HypF [Actinocorallia sp. API 0066]MCD0449901.1 carbamoyltransferase HypF [Actinocorallia sp. API 0066]
MTGARARVRIRVEGIVQGVGFRPFVHELAGRHGIAGFVGNDAEGVFAEAEGEPGPLDAFVADLNRCAPPLAVVERVVAIPAEPVGTLGFAIVPSTSSTPGKARSALVSPDTATCADCLREMADPADRRHGYPFTNCTACGPRYTITTDVPYDRPNTTMRDFALCADCAREYADPADRRFHAQPVCCPACGPSLSFLDAEGKPLEGDPLETAASWLRAGRILAIKGLGGYHLAVLASDGPAVARLRERKRREEKPFAVMAPSLAAARTLVEIDDAAAAVLTGPRRPIVLLPRLPGAGVAEEVAPGAPELGVLLPYTPLHHLLAARVAAPFVLTSGNLSDEPIEHNDEAALARLGPLADALLTHDRPIHARADDSVVRLVRGREVPLRRSRGSAPAPLTTHRPFARPVLACGPELKNTFCLARGSRAFVSPHVGDLENHATLTAYAQGIARYRRLFGISPEVVAHDLHPEYLSTKYALELAEAEGLELVGVQHHHAHVVSCLADNGVAGPVLGIAFDGLGYGPDGTLWGGEVLVADAAGYRRAAHLAPVPMPGGAAAIREPWRMAAAYLDAAYAGDVPELPLMARHADRWSAVTSLARSGTHAPLTSSAGRLFDAVAALAGLRDTVRHEGQAAIALQHAADPSEPGSYPIDISDGDPMVLSCAPLIRAVTDDIRRSTPPPVIAARFHNALAEAVLTTARTLRSRTGLTTTALTGGVFQNPLLLTTLTTALETSGFHVLLHHRVPPNDGGLSLGQAVIAAAHA